MFEFISNFCSLSCRSIFGDLSEANFSWGDIYSFSQFGKEKIKTITSPAARECFRKKYFVLADLKELDWKEIDSLTSPDARKAYQLNNFKPDDLKGLGWLEIGILTSLKPGELSDLPAWKLKALTSPDAQNAAQLERVLKEACELHHTDCFRIYNSEDLRDLSQKEIDALTSPDARKTYELGHFELKDLKEFDWIKIKTITSPAARECFRKKYFVPADLKELDWKEIDSLTSPDARKAYQLNNFKPDDLKGLGWLEIGILTSLKPDEWNDLPAWKHKALTSPDAQNAAQLERVLKEAYELHHAYCLKIYNSEDLKGLPLSTIKALTSWNAWNCYEKGYLKIEDLKDLQAEAIDDLTSWGSQMYYMFKSYTMPADLEGYSVMKWATLRSSDVQEFYKAGYLTEGDLKALDYSGIISMTSKIAKELFKSGKSLEEVCGVQKIDCSKILERRAVEEAEEAIAQAAQIIEEAPVDTATLMGGTPTTPEIDAVEVDTTEDEQGSGSFMCDYFAIGC